MKKSFSEDLNLSEVLHSRRLGRELAMRWFFSRDLKADEGPFDPELWEDFKAQSLESGDFQGGKCFRSGAKYALRLVGEMFRNMARIDAAIAGNAKGWTLDRLAAVDRNIMRVAICEMLLIEEVPPVVSIDEALNIAREYSNDDATSFINGVLNSVKDSLD